MSTEATPYAAPRGPRRRRATRDGLVVVGLTGGFGAGKSTVARALAAAGARVVDADRMGHAVLEEAGVRRELAAAFGADVLGADGGVRRDELGRRAFATPEALARLNAVVHPRLLSRLRDEIESLAAEGYRGLVVLDAALLVEWDLGAWCDVVVAVTAPLEARRRRAQTALGLSDADVEARLARQLPEEERVRYADRVLVNDGSEEDLAERAAALAAELVPPS